MKRALSILLTTAMLLSGIPFSARADEVTEEEEIVFSQDAEADSQDRNESIAVAAEENYTDNGQDELLSIITPVSSANSFENTPDGPTVEIYKPQQPWRCRESEMHGADANQVGYQYEAMYSQVVEDNKKINQFIVQFGGTANASTLEALTNNATTATKTFSVGTEEYTVVVLGEKVLPDEYMNTVKNAVSFIQPDYELELCTIETSNQELSSTESVPENQEDDQVTSYTAGNTGEDIVIALLDTGIDLTHPALAGHLVDGQNFVGGSAVSATGTSFGEAHGTHIAGVIASNAPNVKIMPLQVFEQGKAHTSDVIAAIQYAEEHGVQIVNCSWGLDKDNPLLFTAMQDSDMMFVTAAGNNGADIATSPFYPASFDLENVLSIASVNSDGSVCYFSNYGTSVDYAAPGFDIQSTVPGGGYDKMSGTSISAGVVSAALARSLLNNESFSASGSIVSAQGLVNAWGGNSEEFMSLNATDLAASASFAISLKEDGTVWAWGANDYGQCGNDSSNGVPVQIPGLENIKDIAAGWTHGVAVDNDGNLWTWGSNTYGELGDGTTVSRNVPMKLMGVTDVNTVEAPGLDNTSVAIKNDGTVLHWGKAGNIITLSPEALELPAMTPHYDSQLNQTVDGKIVKIVYAYGGYDDAFIGIDNNGSMWVWDVSDNGIVMPELSPECYDITDIAVGVNFVVALQQNGQVHAKGRNTFGELGNGTTEPQDLFQHLQAFAEVKAIGTSCSSIYITTESGLVCCAGDCSFGKNGRVSFEQPQYFHQLLSSASSQMDYPMSVCGGMSYTVFGRPNLTMTGSTPMIEYSMGDNSRGYLGVRQEIREEMDETKVGSNPPLKVIDSDIITVKNIPVYASSEVWSSIENLIPETITLYLEDGITTVERKLSFDPSSFDDPGFYGDEKGCFFYDVSDDSRTVRGTLTWPWTDECPSGIDCYFLDKSTMFIEATRQRMISTPAMNPIVLPGPYAYDVALPPTVPVILDITGHTEVPVLWNDSYVGPISFGEGVHTVTGRFVDPEALISTSSYVPTIRVIVGTQALSYVYLLDPIQVEWNISEQELRNALPETVTVMLTCAVPINLSVTWNVGSFDNSLAGQTQTITGEIVLPDGIENPNNVHTSIEVTIEKASISSIGEICGIWGWKGTPVDGLNLPDKVEVGLPNGSTRMVQVTWDTTNYDPNTIGSQAITGTLVLPDDLQNPLGWEPQIEITIKEKLNISSIGEISGIRARKGTPVEDLDLPDEVEVVLSDETTRMIQVTWGTDSYDPYLLGIQTITGTMVLPDGVQNILSLDPQIEITVWVPIQTIIEIPEVTIETNQGIWPTQAEREHPIAVENGTNVDTVPFPETVTVSVSDGSNENATVDLPVVWEVKNYDPSQTGLQTIMGEVTLPEDGSIINPQDIKASLKITVSPKEYQVLEVSPQEIEIEALLGTTIAQLNEQLKAEDKAVISIMGYALPEETDAYTFCKIELPAEENNSYQKDIPGQYILTAQMEDNFIPFDDTLPGPIHVTVTVLSPSEIVEVETIHMDAYQSVDPSNLDGVPGQANVTLENGKTVAVDVVWDWREYRATKDTAGEHIVLGEFVNLPASVKQPNGTPLKATMIVNTLPVSYTVTGVLSDNMFEGDAGFTLAELTEILEPTLTLEITSTTPGIEITTEYEAAVSLEGESDPEYDPELSELYVIDAVLQLPNNITCPADGGYNQVLLQTNAVEVDSVEPKYVITTEGTAFADIQGLPTQVSLTLSSVGLDGNHKTAIVDVDWGNGTGYDPHPTQWDENGQAVMEVTGSLVNCPQYINGAGVEAKLYVTVTQSFNLVAITPNRFPASGTMAVNLGSSLQDIYNQLESHSVQLTLQDSAGVTSTADVTFQLRAEDNPTYDPMHECGEDESITLKAYLPLDSKIQNPDNLGVEIVIALKKYQITNAKSVRVPALGSGIQIPTGTPFNELGLPERAPLARSDGATDSAPVTWDNSKYNPNKVGSQVVNGTFVTPLPVHLENPNNRQPRAAVTLVNPAAKILSLRQVEKPMMLSMDEAEDDSYLPGFEEYCYLAEILYEDGTISTELISVFVEIMQ